jgi:YggT family protein
MSGFTAVGFYLISLFFGLIIFSLWLRIALRYLRISALSQLGQLIHSITTPLIQPFNTLLKQKYKPGQKFDHMAFIILVCVEFIKITSISFLIFHALIPFVYIVLYVLADLVIQPCNILFYAIIIRVIMSFANPSWHHPINDFLRLLTNPLLILGRKIVPDISGFDFSPFIIMILLKVITLFISASLPGNLL